MKIKTQQEVDDWKREPDLVIQTSKSRQEPKIFRAVSHRAARQIFLDKVKVLQVDRKIKMLTSLSVADI